MPHESTFKPTYTLAATDCQGDKKRIQEVQNGARRRRRYI
jgi:hypothetical protein